MQVKAVPIRKDDEVQVVRGTYKVPEPCLSLPLQQILFTRQRRLLCCQTKRLLRNGIRLWRCGHDMGWRTAVARTHTL